MIRPLTEDQVAIREAARDYLRDHASFARLRQTIESDAGWDEALWRGFATELGFAGLGIAEVHGGSGLGAIEQSLVLEELGRTLAPIPYFESAVLAANLIALAADGMKKAELLPGIAGGETIATVVLRSAKGGGFPDCIGLSLERDGWKLDGEANFVPFGGAAALLVVAARTGSGRGWDGLSLIAVPSNLSGVTIRRQASLDLTRPYSSIQFDGVRLSTDQLLGEPGGAGVALRRALSIGAGLLASEQLGGAARSLEETVAYSKERVQFDRPIGSFQAVKHRLADMKLLVDAARSAAGWAAEAIASGEGFDIPCAAARSFCTDAYLACAGDAIQLHGGIGFTWEHHAHLFFKRARSSTTLFDPPEMCRERVAQAILDTPEPEPPE
jgi:alkylation response protein AidB-like acyl-CoA dehydrogenase